MVASSNLVIPSLASIIHREEQDSHCKISCTLNRLKTWEIRRINEIKPLDVNKNSQIVPTFVN